MKSLRELATQVSRKADTEGTQISVAEVSRVQAVLFKILSELPTEEAFALVGKGIAKAKKK